MAKKVKWAILFIVLALLAAGGIYLAPKAASVWRMRRIAKAFVDSSTQSTFKETKTTLVYDKNGEELCQIKSSKELYYVTFDQIPKTLANAFVVMEDRDFYNHSGIDYKAIVRAALANQKSSEIVQGASTITQQLARNIFLTQEVTWERKIEEMFIAWDLEKKYSKEEILEFYLNNIYFGNGYYGVEAAARGYFSKSVSELTLSEQAFIAAIPNNPSKYNPLTNFENTLKRRDLILEQMYETDYITSMDFYTAKSEEVVLNQPQQKKEDNSVVTYVRHCATESLMKSAGFSFRDNFDTQEEQDEYESLYDTYYTRCQQMLLSGGYTVYTSFDTELQEKLQRAVDENLSQYTELSDEGVYKMQGAATCIDNVTGNVVAIVGSRSQDLTGYTLNRAYQSYRQSGSAIKPLSVYLPYLQLGNTADSIVTDEPIEGGPVNSDGAYWGDMTVRDAVKYSKNTVAWKIYQEITPRVCISYLLKMDFKKVWYDKDYNAGALGGFTYGVTTEEMAGGYAAIANDGVYRKATCIQRIDGADGVTVIDESSRGMRVYEVNASRMMTSILESVVEPDGTGAAGAVDNAVIAGKTGTTNSNRDMWFCGYSAYYTTAVWIGYDYPQEIHGYNSASAIFKQFMTEVHENLPMQEITGYTSSMQQESQTEAQTDADAENTQESSQESTAAPPEQVTNPGNQGTTGNGQGQQQPSSGSSETTPTETSTYPPGEWDAPTQTDPDAPIQGDIDAPTGGGEW
jgi:penicillin-binding protein 1A